MVRNFDGKKGYGISIDWWSVGVLCYELLTGDSPFAVENKTSRKEIASKILHTNPPMSKIVCEDARDLIKGLLKKQPSKRLGK